MTDRSNPRRGRVLVIDDDGRILRTVRRCIGHGHDVITLERARDALALLTEGQRFDVILCDLMMPDIDGIDFYARLSSFDLGMSARVVFITGGATTSSAQAFLDSVSNEVIEKPFGLAQVRELVARRVPRSAPE